MKSINTLLKSISNKKLLVIFPHPDDETVMTSGLIAQAVEKGWDVKVVSVTNGSLGQIHVHGHGRNIVRIRRHELQRALRILGVTDFEMWRHADGYLKELRPWRSEVTKLIKSYNPGVIVSYGPDGVSGHPDHLALGQQVFKNWLQNQDTVLLWPSFKNTVLNYLEEKTQTAERIVPPTYIVKLSPKNTKQKILALQAHKSQDLANPLKWLEAEQTEYFARATLGKKYDYSFIAFDLGI